MNYIFRCNTLYHLLLSIIFIEIKKIKQQSYIVFKDSVNNKSELVDGIFDRLLKRNFNVIAIFEKRWDKFFCFCRDRKIIKKIKSNGEICLYNFHWNIESVYLDSFVYFKQSDSVFLVEDGALCYLNYLGNTFKRFLKKLIGLNINFIKNEKIKKIYVSDVTKYEFSDSEKLCKLDINNLIDSNNELIDLIKEIFFGFDGCEIRNTTENEKTVIVFTQPLSEDGYIQENRKIEIYREIVNFYSSYGKIFLKIHPRDLTDYSELKCTIIGKDYPSELLNLLNLKYDVAVGICTSAVENSSANERININPNFLNDKKFELGNL